MAGMFAYIAGSPFVLIDLYGIPSEHYGWYFGVNAFGLIAASQINAAMLRYVPARTLLGRAIWAPPIIGGSLLVLSWTGTISLAWFAIGFFAFLTSIGWIIPNAAASALAHQTKTAGSAAAMISAIQFSLATVVGALIGLLHDGTGTPLALMMACAGCGSWIAHRLLIVGGESSRLPQPT